jgi:hypothetical protein
MVATTVKGREMIAMQTRMEGQDRSRYRNQNQNRRLESERRNSVRASQNVRISPYLHDFA